MTGCDIDGDGLGDVALGMPGLTSTTSGQMYGSAGRVMLLYGAASWTAAPLTLVGGPSSTGVQGLQLPRERQPHGRGRAAHRHQAHPRPRTAKVVLLCNLSEGGSGFMVESDPTATSPRVWAYDIVRDRENNTAWLSFKVMMDWDFPTRTSATRPSRSWPARGRRPAPSTGAKDLFRVENDLDLLGPLAVRGEWQGARLEGQWVGRTSACRSRAGRGLRGTRRVPPRACARPCCSTTRATTRRYPSRAARHRAHHRGGPHKPTSTRTSRSPSRTCPAPPSSCRARASTSG